MNRTPVYSMHHEIDNWKLAGVAALGIVCGVLLAAAAALLWQAAQTVQVM